MTNTSPLLLFNFQLSPITYWKLNALSLRDVNLNRGLQMDLELLKLYATSLIGIRYFYGGDDAVSGFDCSGLASEFARAGGLEAWNFRMNAQQIFDRWKSRFRSVSVTSVQLGDFVFYGTSEKTIEHVGFCVDRNTIIEAGGGDAATLTAPDASAKNAFVRMRPLTYRRFAFAILRPVYPLYISPPEGKTNGT